MNSEWCVRGDGSLTTANPPSLESGTPRSKSFFDDDGVVY